MKIWIIIGAVASAEEWESGLQAGGAAALKKSGIEVYVYRRNDIVYTVGGDGTRTFYAKGEEVTAPDKVLLYGHCDGMLEGIEDALTAAGATSINPFAAKHIACSKLKTAQLLATGNLPQAKTIPIYRDTPKELIIKEIGLPLVVKPDLGYGGKGVELIKTEEELVSFLEALPEKPEDAMLAQKYIATSKGRDLRVILVGGKVYAAVVRQAGDPDEFRSNIHQGGHYEDYEMTDDIIELCEKAAKLSGLTICGLDLLFTENGFVIGEINDSPGMRTLVEKVGFQKFLQGILK